MESALWGADSFLTGFLGPTAPPTPETSHGSHELPAHLVAGFQAQPQQHVLAPQPQRVAQRDAFPPAGAQAAGQNSSLSELLSLGNNLMDGDLFGPPSRSLPEAMPAYPVFEAPQAAAMPSAGFSDIAQVRLSLVLDQAGLEHCRNLGHFSTVIPPCMHIGVICQVFSLDPRSDVYSCL